MFTELCRHLICSM